MLYAAIIAVVGCIMLYALATRSSISINALHERNPLAVALSEGGVRNDYTVRLLNKSGHSRSFAMEVLGLPDASVRVAGTAPGANGRPTVEVGPDQTREIRLSVQVASTAVPVAPASVTIRAIDTTTGQIASAAEHFVPANR